MLHDLENKGNEEHGHDKFDQENLEYHFATVVATISWAELSNVVGTGDWEGLVILRQEDHSSSAEDATEASTNELEKHNDLSVYNTEGEIIVSVLNHHSNSNSGIKMATTNGTKHLRTNGHCQAHANWCMR